MTLVSVIVCLVLIASEVYRYVVPKQKEHMVVDPVIEGAYFRGRYIRTPASVGSPAAAG